MTAIKKILSFLPENLQSVFNTVDCSVLERINEIRIRRSKPIVIIISNTAYFLDYNGDIYDYLHHSCVSVYEELFEKTFLSLCDYSLYSTMPELVNGYITLPYGARVGVASTGVYDGNSLSSVKDVTSLNIRIPSQSEGCSREILNFLYISSFPSIIVAGKPNSGKTTLLRDLAKNLSDGFNYKYRKIVLIDERNEFAGKAASDFMLSVGTNCDVITSCKKALAIETATRTMSPEMIVCDEISTPDELESISFAFSSGIKFALSVHIGKKEDLFNKPIIRSLLLTREFEYVVLLDEYTYKSEIIGATEILNEICGSSDSVSERSVGGNGKMRAYREKNKNMF